MASAGVVDPLRFRYRSRRRDAAAVRRLRLGHVILLETISRADPYANLGKSRLDDLHTKVAAAGPTRSQRVRCRSSFVCLFLFCLFVAWQPGPNREYWVLPSFFFLVLILIKVSAFLMGLAGIDPVGPSSTELYRVLWVRPSFTGFYRVFFVALTSCA